VSLEKETEIRSAWEAYRTLNVPGYEDEKEGILAAENLKKAFIAQGLTLMDKDLAEAIEILNPEQESIIMFEPFFEVSAVYQNQKEDSEGGLEDEEEQGAAQQAEIDEAFKLFTKGYNRPITVQDLRQVARTLKEDVDESVLRAMILEANGNKGVSSGVSKDDFADVATRAGALR
jgi:Ca2+-binding EF-hand superfamily protein